jgi:hypothetical protein
MTIGDAVELSSPDKSVKVWADTTREALQLRVDWDGRTVLEPSPVGLRLADGPWGPDLYFGAVNRSSRDALVACRGVHSRAREHFTSVSIELRRGDQAVGELELRVANDGVAYRLGLFQQRPYEIRGDLGAWRVPHDSVVWHHSNAVNYEGVYRKSTAGAMPAETVVAPPLVGQLAAGRGYLAITESSLLNASGLALRCAGSARFENVYLHDPDGWTVHGPWSTPWRVLILARDLNALVDSDLVWVGAPPPAPDLVGAEWIRPGRCVWSWRAEGTGDVKLQRRYVDHAVDLGFEYSLVDDGWERWRENDRGPWDLLGDVVVYGRKRGVGIWAWKRWNELADADSRRAFFRRLAEIGLVGVKIDFMDSESLERVRFYESALRDAAEARLMVNFHGANKPTGLARTHPHEMTREGIYGLEQDGGRGGGAAHDATLPFTRYIAGHADFTPCTFDPAMLGDTTVAHQLATAIVFTAGGLLCWGDDPTRYRSSPMADLVRSIPVTWDETVVLPGSAIGEVAAFARRHGDQWFIGVVNAPEARKLRLLLDFLGPGCFRCDMALDHPGEPTDVRRASKVVEAKNHLSAPLVSGGGFVARLVPTEDKPVP